MVPDRNSTEAYLFLLSSNAYFPCLTVAIHSLKQTGTNRDIIVFITSNIWENLEDPLKQLGTIPLRIPSVPNPSKSRTRKHLRDNFTKLRAWQLSEYSRIIYCDSDFIFTRNSDDLFSHPGKVVAGRNFYSTAGEWPDPDYFNAGYMVLTPSTETYCDMILAAENFESRTGGDQPFQNIFWGDTWEEFNYKHEGANANVYFTRPQDWDADKIRSIHFTKATNPCNTKFEEDIREKWDEFEKYGFPDDYNPLVLWINARDALLNEFPEFSILFDQCGFMLGWDDAGQAAINKEGAAFYDPDFGFW